MKYYSEHVCMLVYLKNDTSKLHEIFGTYISYLWLWLGTVLRTSGFVDDVMNDSHNGPYGAWLIVTNQGAAPGGKVVTSMIDLFVTVPFHCYQRKQTAEAHAYILHCVQKKHPLVFSFITSSQI